MQRKLQRSVTEARRSVISRPSLSLNITHSLLARSRFLASPLDSARGRLGMTSVLCPRAQKNLQPIPVLEAATGRRLRGSPFQQPFAPPILSGSLKVNGSRPTFAGHGSPLAAHCKRHRPGTIGCLSRRLPGSETSLMIAPLGRKCKAATHRLKKAKIENGK